jgi:hypothetical protein
MSVWDQLVGETAAVRLVESLIWTRKSIYCGFEYKYLF